MAFFTIANTATYLSDTGTVNATSFPVTMPTGIVAGDVLFCVATVDGAATMPVLNTNSPGWEKLNQIAVGTAAAVCFFINRSARANETLTIGSSTSEQLSAVTYRLTRPSVGGTVDVYFSTLTGTTANPNPPALTPLGGARDYLFITGGGWDGNPTVTATAPTNYTGLTQTAASNAANGTKTVTATRSVNVATEDPGALTVGAEDWVAFTVALAHQPAVSFGSGPVIRSSARYAQTAAGATSHTCPAPAGIQVGDYLFAVQTGDADNSLAAMTMTGFTELASGAPTSGTNIPAYKVYGKVAVTADTTATGFAFTDGVTSPSTGSDTAMVMLAIQAGTYDTTTPVTFGMVNTVTRTPGATVHTALSMAGVLNGLLLAIYCGDSNQSYQWFPSTAPPTGMTLADQVQGQARYSLLGIYRQALTAAGATGDKTVTPVNAATTTNSFSAFQAVINPATASSVPKVGSDSFASTDVVTSLLRASALTDSFPLTEVVALTRASALSDTFALGVETASLVIFETKLSADTFDLLVESAVVVASEVRSATDSFGFTDSAVVTTSESKTATDTFGFTESVVLAQASSVSDTFAFTDTSALSQLISLFASDSFAFIDTASLVMSLAVSANDTFAFTDARTTAAASTVSDTFSLGTETATVAITSTQTDSFAFTDTQVGAQNFARSDTFAFTDTSALTQLIFKTASDSFVFTDISSLQQVVALAVSDTFAFTDATKSLALSFALSDTFTFIDTQTSALSAVASDSFVFTDAAVIQRTNFITTSDTFGFTDTSALAATLLVSEAFSFTDVSVLTLASTLTDSFAFTDSSSVQQGTNPFVNDTFAFTDTARIAVTQALSDTFVLGTETASASQARTATDSFALGTETATILRSTSVSDTFDFTDTRTTSASLVANDSFTLTESATNGANRATSDSFVFTESAVVVVTIMRQDSFALTETTSTSTQVAAHDSFGLTEQVSASAFLSRLDTFVLTDQSSLATYDLKSATDTFGLVDSANVLVTLGGPWPIDVHSPVVGEDWIETTNPVVGESPIVGQAQVTTGPIAVGAQVSRPAIATSDPQVRKNIEVEV